MGNSIGKHCCREIHVAQCALLSVEFGTALDSLLFSLFGYYGASMFSLMRSLHFNLFVMSNVKKCICNC
jgi:hypothetical protein